MRKKSKTKLKFFIGYARQSLSEDKQQNSIAVQVRRIKEFVKKHDGVLLTPETDNAEGGCYVDRLSGSKGESKRPGLAQALKHAKSSKAVIVCQKVDRLSRSLRDFVNMSSDFDIRFTDQDNVGSIGLKILSVFSDFEREQISTRTSQALQLLKSKGKKLGSHNPKVMRGLKKYWKERKAIAQYNLAKNKKLKKVRVKKRIEKQISKRKEFDNQVYPYIRELRGDGLTLSQISQNLNADFRKYPTRSGGAWTAKQVLRIINRNK